MKKLLFLFLFSLLLIQLVNATYCYQETANVSTGGDGSCGLEYTGTYACSGLWASPTGACINSFDGNWTSAGWGLTTNQGYLEINYSKPTNAISDSLWQVNPTLANLSIPSDCWDYNADLLVFRAHSSDASNNDFFECMNKTGNWKEVVSGASGEIYEEAMWWNVTAGGSGGASCNYTSGNWEVNATDTCSWTTLTNLNHNNLFISELGTVTLTGIITNATTITVQGATLHIQGGTLQTG